MKFIILDGTPERVCEPLSHNISLLPGFANCCIWSVAYQYECQLAKVASIGQTTADSIVR